MDDNRFWSKVEKTDGCWLWTASCNAKGYGQINVGGRPCLAHRLSFAEAVGPIPTGLFVLHKCDVPNCVRPDHLFLGTIAENNADMRAKGRASGGSFPGELAPWAKLTADKVAEARRRFAYPGGYREAAGFLGCSVTHAHRVVTRRAWRHIP